MLGADGIFVELGGEAHELRPSLRASMHLVRRHQLFGLLAAAHDFNVTVISDMFREAGIKPALLMAEIATHGLGNVRNQLTVPLIAFVRAIAGVDPDNTTQIKPATSKPADPEQTFAQLFCVATGALGWTHQEAWTATPAEIIAAHNGQTAHLIRTGVLVEQRPGETAAPYTHEQLKQIEEEGHAPAFDRFGLHALKGKERVT